MQFPLVLPNLGSNALDRLFMTGIPGFVAEDLPPSSLIFQWGWVAVSTFLCWGLGVFHFAAIVREKHDVFRFLQPIREASGRPFAVDDYSVI